MYNSPRTNAVRRRIITLMQDGHSRVSRIAAASGKGRSDSALSKSHVHYHLQRFLDADEQETDVQIVKLGDRYYLKGYVLRNQRRFIGKLKKRRDSVIENHVNRRFNPGVLGRKVKELKQQKWTLRSMGIDVHVNMSPEYIVREKRQHVKRAMEQPHALSRNVGRKFEQLHEYRALLDWVEGFFRYDVPDALRSVPISNPAARRKVESLPSVMPA